MFKQFTTTTTTTTSPTNGIPLIVVDEFQIFPHIQNEFLKCINASRKEEDTFYSTVLLNTKYKPSSSSLSSSVLPSQQQQQQLLLQQTIPLIQSSSNSDGSNDSTITVPRIQLQISTNTPPSTTQPVLHLYFLQCDDVDVYKRIIKQQLKLFIESINKTKKGNDYMVVYVSYGNSNSTSVSTNTASSTSTSTSTSTNSSVLDKLKSDFPSRKIIHFKANNLNSTSNVDNSNVAVLDSIVASQLDLSFSYLTQLHDESTQKEQQQLRLPGFNYFSYFLVKLNIYMLLESLGYCDLSLRQLEHLFDLMQSSLDIILVQGQKEGELVSWGEYFGDFSFSAVTAHPRDYMELIRRNQITVLDFSLFLILNQLRLLKQLCSSASSNKQYLKNLYLKKVKNYLVDITCTYYKYHRGKSSDATMKVAGWLYSFIMEVLEYYEKEFFISDVDGSVKSSLLADLLYDAKVQLDKITSKLKYTPPLLQDKFDLDYATVSHTKDFLEQNICNNPSLIDSLLDFSWKYVQLYEGIVEKIVFNCSASNSRIVPLVYYDLCLLYYHSYNHFRLGINKNQQYDADSRDGATAEDHFKSLLLESVTLMKQHISLSVKDVLDGVEINASFTKGGNSTVAVLSPIDEHCMLLLKNLYFALEMYNEYLRVLLGLVVVVVSETPSRSSVYLKEFLHNRDKMIKYSTDLIRLQLEQMFNIVEVDFVENQFVDLTLEGIFHEDNDDGKLLLSPDEQLEVYSVQLQAFGSQDLTFKSDGNNCSLKLDGITKIRLKVSSSSVTAISSDSLVLGDLEVQLDDCNTITLIHSFMSEKSKVIFDVVKDERSTDVEFRKPRLIQTDSHQFLLDQNDSDENGESQEWIEMEIVIYGGQRGIEQGARLMVQYAPIGGDVNRSGEFKLNKIDYGEEQDDLYDIENNPDSSNTNTIVLKNRVKSMESLTVKVLVKFPEYHGDDYYNEGCFIDGLKVSLEFHSFSSAAESDKVLPPDLHKIVRDFNNVFIMNLIELEEVLEDGQQLILRNQYSHPLRILTDMKTDKSFPLIIYADQVLHYYKEDLSELRIDYIPVDLELVIIAENNLYDRMDSYKVLQPKREYYKRFLGYLLFKYYLSDMVIKKYWLNGSTKLSFKQAGLKSENRSNIFTEYFRRIQFIVGLNKLENTVIERKASKSDDSIAAALCAILDEAEGLIVKRPQKKDFHLFDEFRLTFHYWNTLRDIKAIGEDPNAYVKVGELVSMELSIDYKKVDSNAVDDLKVLVSFQNDNPNWLIIGKIKKNLVIKDGDAVILKLVFVPLKVGIVQLPEFDVTVTNITESETYLYKVKQEKDNVMLIHPRHKTKSFLVDLNPNDMEAQKFTDFTRNNITFNASGRLHSVHSKIGLASPFGPGSDSRRLGTSSMPLFSPAVTKLNEFQVPEDLKLDDNDSIEKEYFDQSRATASVPASPVGQSLDRSQSNSNNAPFSNASESSFPRGSYSTTTSAKWNWLNPASIGSAIMKHAKSTSFSGTGTSFNKRRNSQNRI